ncbi:DEAD/DEAH box helicase [Rhodococcoides yunnanense]|uniref:DEAD/DEAH box helicase n=1 Tax=Rhodococcoides yunnanense TaxID=278209 RepID=UPI0009337AC7|nr:DEAD/DEAH box helicase [Rhodococcus yunnanensis]
MPQHSSFADLGLAPVVTHALRRIGVESPFPIQAAAIPDALGGRDILGHAPTGSGKTLAFGLPLLQRLSGSSSRPSSPRGLVLVPTRELALQIEASLDEPALASGVRVMAIVGGVPLKRHIERLRRGVDVVVATPGRLEDLTAQDAVSLADVTVTVVDEADRMSDLGFLPQVRKLLDRTSKDGQRMLFSATLDGDVSELVEQYLHSPVVHRTESTEPERAAMSHHFFRVSAEEKDSVATVLAARDGRTIVFLRTKHAVDRFAEGLRTAGVDAVALHGDKTQAARTRALASFGNGSVPVLVATDVAARGLHVDGVTLVLHVDPPADAKDYTHRAGRTARAGDSGTVVTLVAPGQEEHVSALAIEAGIAVAFTDVTRSSPVLREVAGARAPTGVPVVRSAAAPAATTPRQGRRNASPARGSREHGQRRGPR